ncbi:MAG: 6-phospho-beta-glucosidase [Chloroflexota bacterium]
MDRKNITVLGGGSAYTPGLVEGLLRLRDQLPLRRLTLMDIDRDKLDTVAALVRKMVAAADPEAEVAATADRGEALTGADFVLCQIRVGGLAARHLDEKLPLKYDVIGQETTGPGGFAMALRTIPVMVDIAREMERRCPDAWLINYTNPTGIVAEAVHRATNAKMISICDIPISIQHFVAIAMGVPRDAISLDYVGLNHLGWVRHVWHEGRDVMPLLRQMADSLDLAHLPPGFVLEDDRMTKDLHYMLKLFKKIGVIPSPYLMYYYYSDELLSRLKADPLTRAEEVMAIERDLLPFYREAAARPEVDLWKKRGGDWHADMMVGMVAAIANDAQSRFIVNLPNSGAIKGLPDDKVVELPAIVGRRGAQALVVGEVPPDMLGLMQVVGAYETLTVEAALEGSYEKALRALALHPLVPSIAVAEKLLDDYLAAHRAYLPQFSGSQGAGA